MWDRTNGVIIRAALILAPQATNPIALGDVGFWFDGTTEFLVKSDGSMVPVVIAGGGSAVQTVNAAPTLINTMPVPANNTLELEVRVAGTRADAGAGAAYVVRGAFRNQAGIVTQVDSTEVDVLFKDDLTWGDPTFVISGTNLLTKVTGKAATTINWSVNILTVEA